MAGRYQCTLSPELLEKAVRELNEPEDNADRLAAIDELRVKFDKEAKVKNLELIRSDDAFLLRFLRVRKFDQDRALKTLINYHNHRKEWKELFELVDNPKQVERLLQAGTILPLRNRAKDDTFVVVVRPGLGFEEKGDMLRFIAIVILTVDKLLEQEEFQIHGLTIIEDLSNFGMMIAMQMMSYGRKFLHVMQEAMPVRIKSLNLVNEALVFDAIYAIMSKFMKEKLKQRLQLHGSNFKTLHEKVDKTHLPFCLDGTGPNLNPDWWVKEILSAEGEGEDTAL